MDTINEEGPASRAEAITVIFTNLLRRGSDKGPHDPVRVVEQFWTEKGRLVAENDSFSYAEYFRDQVLEVLRNNEGVLVRHLGVSFSVEDPASWLIDVIDKVVDLAADVESLSAENQRLEAALDNTVSVETHNALDPAEVVGVDPRPMSYKWIFKLSTHDSAFTQPEGLLRVEEEDEVVAVFKETPDVDANTLWVLVQEAVRVTLSTGVNPDPDRFNIPLTPVFKRLFGYRALFKGDSLESVEAITFTKSL